MKIRCLNCMEEYEAFDGQKAECPYCGFVHGTPPKQLYYLYPGVELFSGRYIIGTVISCGGFGITYRAWDTTLQTLVAIKEFFPAEMVNRNPGERNVFVYENKTAEFENNLGGFILEAKNTAKFSEEENIVKVYSSFPENGTAYMVMEFMRGQTLRQYLDKNGGRIPFDQVVDIGCSVMDILKTVHKAGIIHRDISPSNIMLCYDGKVKLFDFGAAQFSDGQSEKTREVILTKGFAPPEQYKTKSVQGPWTDIYALGATLYTALTGVLPPESQDRQSDLHEKKPDPLVRAKKIIPELPDYIDKAISRAMAVEPDLRFRDCEQFKNAITNKKPSRDVEEELRRRKRNRVLGIGAVLCLLAAGFLGCFRYYRVKSREAYLDNTTLTVWLSEDGDGKEKIFREMSEEFLEDYPVVQLSIVSIPAEEYAERLESAADTGEFPVIFEAEPAAEKARQRAKDLTEFYSAADSGALMFVEDASEDPYRVPLGFDVPVIYRNTLLAEEDQEGKDGSAEEFLAGELPLFVSGVSFYRDVQEALPGVYSVEYDEQEDPGVFTNCFSVDSRASGLDQTAAERLFSYWEGEKAQDILHIRNSNSLPLNRKEFGIYQQVNVELGFLGGISEGGIGFRDEASFDQACHEICRKAAERR